MFLMHFRLQSFNGLMSPSVSIIGLIMGSFSEEDNQYLNFACALRQLRFLGNQQLVFDEYPLPEGLNRLKYLD